MEKENKLTIEQARQIESLLSEYGVSNVLDCDFSNLALFTFENFFEVLPRVIAFLSEAVTKVGDNPTKAAIECMIEQMGHVSYTLSQVHFFYQPLYSISRLISDINETLNDGNE